MKKKVVVHAPTTCGGEFQTNHTDENIPYLKCGKCNYEINDWIEWSRIYSGFWKEEGRWSSKKDLATCILGYFVNLFERHYGTTFVFSLSEKGLFRGTEMFHIRKLMAMLKNDGVRVRAYLDWVFDKKVRQRKTRITSLGFLHTPDLVNEFCIHFKKTSYVTRSTPLPEKMIKWVEANAPDLWAQTTLKDGGDLYALLTHYRGGFMSDSPDAQKFIQKLKSSKIIDDGLNIINWSEKC